MSAKYRTASESLRAWKRGDSTEFLSFLGFLDSEKSAKASDITYCLEKPGKYDGEYSEFVNHDDYFG